MILNLKSITPQLFLKMTYTSFKSKFPKDTKHKTEKINNFGEGITKKLLEKYKTKVICNIDIISTRNTQKRVS